MSNLTVVKVEDPSLETWQRDAEIYVTDRNVIVHVEVQTPKGRVKFFLRRHRGDGGHFWDHMFGDDYGTPENAVEALLSARAPMTAFISEKIRMRSA